MQPKIEFMHLCEHGFLDQHQRVCLIGIFDTVNAGALPAKLERMCIAGRIIGRPNDLVPVQWLSSETKIESPISESQSELSCGETGEHGFILEFSGLEFPDNGRYAVGIFLSPDKPLAVSYVTVRTQPAHHRGGVTH